MKGLYGKFFEEDGLQAYAKFFDILLNQEEGAILWHCTMGKDRCGTGAILLETALGVPEYFILADYLYTNNRINHITEDTIAQARLVENDDNLMHIIRIMDAVHPDYIDAIHSYAEAISGSLENLIRTKLGMTEEKIARLRELYLPVVNHPDVAVLDIATRPDCLSPEVLEVLAELAAVKPLWVELGLQTIHPETAKFIRRGYDLPVFDEAVKNLHAIGAEVIVHQIIGLPNETEEMIYETAEYIGRSGADGVKFHLLHVVEHTDLAKLYREGAFETLTMERYFELLAGCIRRIPKNMVVHRLTGDGEKRTLIAPLWSGNKKHVLNSMNRYFDEIGLEQGSAIQ
jgi:radical SAM protein (TIGR01212 family)